MMSVQGHKRYCFLTRFLLFFCMVTMLIFGSSSTVMATSVDGEESDAIGTSLYDVSTALTAYVNRVLSPNANEKHSGNKITETSGQNIGNAGAFVGYGDTDRDFKSFIISNMSGSASTSTYHGWIKMEKNGKNTIYGYCRYGYLLNDLGLDQTAPNTTGITFRLIIGALVYMVYAVAAFIPKVFSVAFQILQMLNPFKLLVSGENEAITDYFKSAMPGLSDGFTGGAATGLTNAVEGVADFFGEIYTKVSNFSWTVVVPMLFVMLLASILFMNTTRTGRTIGSEKIPTFLKRVVFIAIGVPILGYLYTATLDKLAAETAGGNVPATQMVVSTFVDFEGWVTQGRLAPPDGAILTSVGTNGESLIESGSASDNSFRKLRNTAFLINKKIGLIPENTDGYFGSDYDIAGGVWDENGNLREDILDEDDDDTQKKVLAMIGRYMTGEFYHASSWESSVSMALNSHHGSHMGSSSSTDAGVSNDNTVYQMFDETDEVDDWMDREEADNNAIFSGTRRDKVKWGASTFNIFTNGDITGGNLIASTDVAKKNITYSGTWPSSSSGGAFNPKNEGGLSTISMYNYLASSFSKSSITTYSDYQASSEYTKKSHYSVNLIGTGALRILYAANCVVVLLVTAMLGVYYALGMCMSNLKRGFKLIAAVPVAVVGVLKQIVQVIVYVITMMAELIGTAFVYTIVSEMLSVFAAIVERLSRDAVSGTVLGGCFGASGLFADMTSMSSGKVSLYAGLTMTTILIFLFGIVAICNHRKVFALHRCIWLFTARMITATEAQWVVDDMIQQDADVMALITYVQKVRNDVKLFVVSVVRRLVCRRKEARVYE